MTNSCKKSIPNQCTIYVSSEGSNVPFNIIYILSTTVENKPEAELMNPARGFLKFLKYKPKIIGINVLDINMEDKKTQRPNIC
jgi:hypothetical protein